MKKISLINGEEVIVDDEDHSRLLGPRWFCSNRKGLLYARRNIKGEKNKKILMHREILGLKNPSIHVDHIDGNGLNNQKTNLRICNQRENMANRRKNSKGSSKYKGVSKRGNRWMCQVGGRMVADYLTEHEAALAYNVTASFAYGEFARLNKIEV